MREVIMMNPARSSNNPAHPQATMWTEYLEVTPELAIDWVTTPRYAGPNRTLTAATVTKYARQMAAGTWRDTGEAIKWGVSGRLLDGQHRLHAIIEAGITVPMLVVHGVPDEAQDVMDSGRARRASDVLAIHGYKNVTQLAAAARLLIGLENGTLSPGNGSLVQASNLDVLTYLREHPDVEAAATGMSGRYRERLSATPSVFLAALVLMTRVDAEDASAFGAAFATGAGLERGNPILTLRERLVLARSKREALSAYVQLSALLRAWNAWRCGQSMLRFPLFGANGPIPVPVPR
jgi:hypothetical protein